MSRNYNPWPMMIGLAVFSGPLALMYVYLFVDTVTNTAPGSLIPNAFTLDHWSFLITNLEGRASIWRVTFNTFVFASSMTIVVLSISCTAGYALSRLNVPFRGFFLAGIMVLHAFPTVTLLIAIFIILQFLGLYNTLVGVILVKASLMLPFGIWIMKGFYDTVPWEIEMAGIQDGASRFTVWWRLVLPIVKPAMFAIGLFTFLDGWSEYVLPQVLAPENDVQVLSVYLASLIADDNNFNMNLFKSVGVFYVLPILLLFIFFQKQLLSMYGGGTKG